MHADHLYQTSVSIGCEGPQTGQMRSGPLGTRRSRAGAQLAHVVADAKHWHEASQRESKSLHEEGRAADEPVTAHHALLVNPTKREVVKALTECGEFLRQFECRPDWNGGTIDFHFAGHGREDGALVLADGVLDADELMELIAVPVRADQPRRKALFVLDCCYSGLTLAKIIVNQHHHSRVLIPDAFAASLPQEAAWELDYLGHGALTFTMRNRGNRYVDRARLAKAVQDGDEQYLRYALQCNVPNPVTYITERDQHALSFLNSHLLEVVGWAEIEVVGADTSLEQLLDAIDAAASAPEPGHRIEIA